MASTKLLFINQPQPTRPGWTLKGSTVTNDDTNQNIQVGIYDANNNLQTTDQSSVTVAFGTNPTAGSLLKGTLTVPSVNGIATFSDLFITLGGTGYTLTATDGGLTSATTVPFNAASVYRVNPVEITGTITATGIANGVGPYRFRRDKYENSVRISVTGSTDTFSIVICEPNATTSENFIVSNYVAASGLVAPFSFVPDAHQVGGQCDIYVVGTTVVGTSIVKVQRAQG